MKHVKMMQSLRDRLCLFSGSVVLTQQMVSTAAFVTVPIAWTVPANGQENGQSHVVENMPFISWPDDYSVD